MKFQKPSSPYIVFLAGLVILAAIEVPENKEEIIGIEPVFAQDNVDKEFNSTTNKVHHASLKIEL